MRQAQGTHGRKDPGRKQGRKDDGVVMLSCTDINHGAGAADTWINRHNRRATHCAVEHRRRTRREERGRASSCTTSTESGTNLRFSRAESTSRMTWCIHWSRMRHAFSVVSCLAGGAFVLHTPFGMNLIIYATLVPESRRRTISALERHATLLSSQALAALLVPGCPDSDNDDMRPTH